MKNWAQISKQLKALDEHLAAIKGAGLSTEQFEKIAGEIEKRVRANMPASPMRGIHPSGSDKDRKEVNKKLHAIIDPESSRADLKALGLTQGETGGYLVPDEFIAELDRKLVAEVVMRSIVRVFTGVGRKGSMPRETGTVTIVWGEENKKESETGNPKFGRIAWGLEKMKALTKLSQELVNNAEVDVIDVLTDMISEQMALEEDSVMTNGTGSGQPSGFRTAPFYPLVQSIAQVGANLAYEDFVNVKHKLPKQYRNGAWWLATNGVIAKAAKIKDTDNRPVFLDMSVFGGQGTNQTIAPQTVGFILGNPVGENNYIPENLGGGTESELWYGNFRRAYFLFDGGTMEMATTTEGWETFETDQVGIKATKFVDGKGANEDAVVYGSGIK